MRNVTENLKREKFRLYGNGDSWTIYFYRKWFDEESKKLMRDVISHFKREGLTLTVTYKKAQHRTLAEVMEAFSKDIAEGVSVITTLIGRKEPTFIATMRGDEFHLELTQLFRAEMEPHPTMASEEAIPSEPSMSPEDILSVMGAFREGKTIEKRFLDEVVWTEDPNPIWAFDRIQYRVKGQRMTNRDLAQWLAEGKGQVRDSNSENAIASTFFSYSPKYDNTECYKGLVVRPWGGDEWVTPTKEMLDE